MQLRRQSGVGGKAVLADIVGRLRLLVPGLLGAGELGAQHLLGEIGGYVVFLRLSQKQAPDYWFVIRKEAMFAENIASLDPFKSSCK